MPISVAIPATAWMDGFYARRTSAADQAGQECHLMRFARATHRPLERVRMQTSSFRTHHPHSVAVARALPNQIAAITLAMMSDSFMNAHPRGSSLPKVRW
jgi:hypothetical protein